MVARLSLPVLRGPVLVQVQGQLGCLIHVRIDHPFGRCGRVIFGQRPLRLAR